MIGIGVLVLAAGLASGPQSATVPRRSVNFHDNDLRNQMVEDFRRQRDADTQAVIAQRRALVLHLDRMVSQGQCPGARTIAVRAGYRDIIQAVDQACAPAPNDGR